jgi:CubicO group peptidase (beta-lactamase class C family)
MAKPTLTLCSLGALAVGLLPGCRADRVSHLARIDEIVAGEIKAGHIPGAVVLVGTSDRILYWKAFGDEVVEPCREPMTRDTLFDLASLTKPLATASSIMVLVDRGRLNVNDCVKGYLPAFAAGGKDAVQIRHLLTHTSGLPAYTNAEALRSEYGSPCPDAVIDKICSLEATSAPGEEFRYSCLGYIILARIVGLVTGQGIDAFSQTNLFDLLGLKDTTFNPPASRQPRIAATEIVDGQLLRGTVHDPLARLMAGTSGNAGLFSTASDLSVFCRMLLNDGVWRGRRILSTEAVEMLTTAQSHGRAYGFDVRSGYAWVKGPYASERAFCHTGYTGVSLVCDPAVDTYLIILTNRVHPSDGGTSRPVRLQIADVVFGPPGESKGSGREKGPDPFNSLTPLIPQSEDGHETVVNRP